MRWIDREGKVGGVIHWLDLLLLLVALAVIIRMVILALPSQDSRETKFIRLEVLAPELPIIQVENIQVGQWVQDDRTGDYLGKIRVKETIPTKRYQFDDGQVFTYLVPERMDLTLQIERRGLVRGEQGIFLGRRMVRAGEEVRFRTLYSVFSGVINRLYVTDE